MPHISLRLPDALATQLDARSEPGRGGLSEAVRESLKRYFYLLDISRREIQDQFTGGEISLLADVCNGTMFESHTLSGVLADAEDAEDAYYDKWGVDRKVLLSKLNALTLCQQAALVDAIERFWTRVATVRSLEQPQPNELLK